jgi:hypothetical protein
MIQIGKLLRGAALPLIALAAWAALLPQASWAGSCCGGGSGIALMVPKYAKAVADLSFDAELYRGFWNQNGRYTADPPGSDLKQYRANLGYARRFFTDWQASFTLPYIWNDNEYSGLSTSTNGLGDASASLWYDLVDDTTTWRAKSLSDLTPSVSIGLSLLLPTGYSPYDDVGSSFDVTGRGFYRLDGNLLIEKTLHPWNLSLAASYGSYFERTVNREYGKYVEPYRKQLGDRSSASLCLGYGFVVGTKGDTLTTTASYAFLNEDDVSYNGANNPSSGFQRQSVGGTVTFSGTDRDWSVRAGWNHAIRETGWGENFPTTDIFSVGVRYVFR